MLLVCRTCAHGGREPSRAFEVCDPVISGDRLSSMGRSTAGHGHPWVVLIASECNHKCNHGRPRQPGHHRPSVRRRDSGDIELWRTLGVIRGVLGVSARAVASAEVMITVRDLVQWKLLVVK